MRNISWLLGVENGATHSTTASSGPWSSLMPEGKKALADDEDEAAAGGRSGSCSIAAPAAVAFCCPRKSRRIVTGAGVCFPVAVRQTLIGAGLGGLVLSPRGSRHRSQLLSAASFCTRTALWPHMIVRNSGQSLQSLWSSDFVASLLLAGVSYGVKF